MPRYFFHLHNDIDAPDEEGVDLVDDQRAIACTLTNARVMAAESVKAGHLDRTHFIQCVNEAGEEIAKVTFGEAVEIRN